MPGDGSGVQQLTAHAVRVQFSGVRAVDGVDLQLRKGEIMGLIGPNGAGKTTLLHVLSGFLRPTAGAVTLGTLDVTRWSSRRVARRGVARTFQNVRLFRALSVLENVELGALGSGRRRKNARAHARDVLASIGLDRLADVPASALAGGDERRVGLARAVAMEPTFLLIDEPAAGLNEIETSELVSVIASVRDRVECGVLLVEHDMRLVMNLCERIHVLDSGKTIGVGTPAEISQDRAVIEAYLGTGGGSHAPPV